MNHINPATILAAETRIQDSAIRAARLLAQHRDEKQHLDDMIAELSQLRQQQHFTPDEGEDG